VEGPRSAYKGSRIEGYTSIYGNKESSGRPTERSHTPDSTRIHSKWLLPYMVLEDLEGEAARDIRHQHTVKMALKCR